MDEKLDLTAFKKAINTFHIALDEYAKDNSNEFVRDSCIQRFEYCYDLSTKYITRYLEQVADDPSSIKAMVFADRIRKAYSVQILKHSFAEWKNYRENRNNTSHGYNEQKAIEIVKQLPDFYQEAFYLCHAIETKQH